MLIIKNKINKKIDFSSMHPDIEVLDKEINYQYNSRGFRDKDWPEDLSNVIWCIGDSFTLGIGQPHEETWPFLLQKNIGKRCLNLGEDGCSNDTITLRVKEIFKLYQPKIIIIMWSFFHRRRINNKNVHSDKNDFGVSNDLENFKKNFIETNTLNCKIINLLIPNAIKSKHKIKNIEEYILKKNIDNYNINIIPQLDYAIDNFHFDIKTSEYIVNLLIKKINDFDK